MAFDMYSRNSANESASNSMYSDDDFQTGRQKQGTYRQMNKSSNTSVDMYGPGIETSHRVTNEKAGMDADTAEQVTKRQLSNAQQFNHELQSVCQVHDPSERIDDLLKLSCESGAEHGLHHDSSYLLQLSQPNGKGRVDSIDPSKIPAMTKPDGEPTGLSITYPFSSTDEGHHRARRAHGIRRNGKRSHTRSRSPLKTSSHLQAFKVSLPDHIEYEGRFNLCQELIYQRFDSIAKRLETKDPRKPVPEPPATKLPVDPQGKARKIASDCCFGCVAALKAAEVGKPYSGGCVRATLTNSQRPKSPSRRKRSQSLLSSRYVAVLKRLSEDATLVPAEALRPPFQVPRDEAEVRAAVHERDVTAMPRRPFEDEDGDCYYDDDSNNVQQFFFCILTHRKWKSWLGETLALVHPIDVSQLCRSFQRVIDGENSTESRPLQANELNSLNTKISLRGCSVLVNMVPIQKLMMDIIWLVICELRGDEPGAIQSHADIRARYERYGQSVADRAAAERDRAREEAKTDQKSWFGWNRATLKSWTKKVRRASVGSLKRSGSKLSARLSRMRSTRQSSEFEDWSEPDSRRTSTSRRSRWSLGLLRMKNRSADAVAGSDASESESLRPNG